jgi:hypothetical protein
MKKKLIVSFLSLIFINTLNATHSMDTTGYDATLNRVRAVNTDKENNNVRHNQSQKLIFNIPSVNSFKKTIKASTIPEKTKAITTQEQETKAGSGGQKTTQLKTDNAKKSSLNNSNGLVQNGNLTTEQRSNIIPVASITTTGSTTGESTAQVVQYESSNALQIEETKEGERKDAQLQMNLHAPSCQNQSLNNSDQIKTNPYKQKNIYKSIKIAQKTLNEISNTVGFLFDQLEGKLRIPTKEFDFIQSLIEKGRQVNLYDIENIQPVYQNSEEAQLHVTLCQACKVQGFKCSVGCNQEESYDTLKLKGQFNVKHINKNNALSLQIEDKNKELNGRDTNFHIRIGQWMSGNFCDKMRKILRDNKGKQWIDIEFQKTPDYAPNFYRTSNQNYAYSIIKTKHYDQNHQQYHHQQFKQK